MRTYSEVLFQRLDLAQFDARDDFDIAKISWLVNVMVSRVLPPDGYSAPGTWVLVSNGTEDALKRDQGHK